MLINSSKIVGGFAVAAVLLGAAVLVVWFLFGRRLEDDVRRMVGKMWTVDTVEAKVQLATALVESIPFFPLPGPVDVRLGVSGPVDLSQKPALDFDLQLRAKTSLPGAELGGELIDLGATRYLRLSQAPRYGEVDLTAFEDEWIKIPGSFSFAPLIGKESLPPFTADDLEQLRDLLTKIDLVEVPDVGLVEIIAGDPALPYHFVFNSEGMKTLLVTLWELRHDAPIDLPSYTKVESQVEALKAMEGTLWIGKRSFLLHRLKLTAPTFELTVNLSDFNEPLTILAPIETKDIKRALSELGFNPAALPEAGSATARLGSAEADDGSLPSSRTGEEKDVDPDEDGLPNSLEVFYGTDQNNPDTDGDGVSDGDEVAKSRNPRGEGSIFSFGLP